MCSIRALQPTCFKSPTYQHLNLYLAIAVTLVASGATLRATKSVTVAELSALVQRDISSNKTDDQIAGDLKDLELSQQLITPAFNALIALKPGPRTVEQLSVQLYASVLKPLPEPPPVNRPTPDAAEQKSITDKLASYITTSFSQVPSFTVNKTVMRFDNSSMSRQQDFRLAQGNGTNTPNTLNATVGLLTRYRGATTTPMQVIHGTESAVTGKAGLASDPLGPIFTEEFGALLPLIAQQSTGNLQWQRWDLIDNIPVAVFAFAVDHKQTHYEVNYCCFAEYDIKGRRGVTPLLSDAEWKPFKKMEPYHGLLYVEPRTGSVLRLILQTDLKTSDNVTQEDTRVDYATVKLGDKSWILPKDQFTQTRVVVSGTNSGHTYTEIRNIYAISYSGFRPHP